MFLETRREWEINDPMMTALGDPGTRHYPMVQVSLNMEIYHV